MAEATLQTNKGFNKAIIAWILFLLCDRMKGKQLWNFGEIITFQMNNGGKRVNGPPPPDLLHTLKIVEKSYKISNQVVFKVSKGIDEELGFLFFFF